MWLLQMEETDGVNIMHCRNVREYIFPELHRFCVNGYCPETRTEYEYFGYFYNSDTCQPFRGVTTLRGDTLAERYEKTMSRLDQITRAGYRVMVQWECEFDDAGMPAVQQSPLRNRDALYGVRTEAMRLHYKARENDTIQYVDFMILYSYICKYFKFHVGHPIVHGGDECKYMEACLRMDGLIKCSIVSPEKFYHPVLPFRCNNKLMFLLCRMCVLTRDEDRA